MKRPLLNQGQRAFKIKFPNTPMDASIEYDVKRLWRWFIRLFK